MFVPPQELQLLKQSSLYGRSAQSNMRSFHLAPRATKTNLWPSCCLDCQPHQSDRILWCLRINDSVPGVHGNANNLPIRHSNHIGALKQLALIDKAAADQKRAQEHRELTAC